MDWLHQIEVPRHLDWLKTQTQLTAPSRQQSLQLLSGIATHGPIIDVGCGLGVMALEMAQAFSLPVIGIDQDPDVLAVANSLAKPTQLAVEFHEGHAESLPFADHSISGITARFVCQHLPHPTLFLHEAFRVLKPHGWLFIEDIDDGLSLEYPPLPEAWQDVLNAFQRYQHRRSGDRFIGRKLGPLLMTQGFETTPVIRSEALCNRLTLSDPSLTWERYRIEEVLPEMERTQILSHQQFEDGWHALTGALPMDQFRSSALVNYLAIKP